MEEEMTIDVNEPLSAIASVGVSESHLGRIFPSEGLVDRHLEGKVLQHDGLVLMRNHRLLLRKDREESAGRVKVVSGGSTRMEPLFSGCVGEGMLTAAVLTPCLSSALAAIRVLAERDPQAGVLCVVPNDPANRLIFGLACQRAAHEGLHALCVTVGEDCSGLTVGRTGRRGSCGVAFLLKIAGAMAEEGRSVYEIACVLGALKGKALGSVNVLLEDDELVVTSGARNETLGVKHRDSLTNVVSEAMFFLFHPLSQHSLYVGKDDEVAVLVAGLGGLSDVHRASIVRELWALLNAAGLNVARLYSCPSLSGGREGFSVSVLCVNDRLLAWLDRPTGAVWWPVAAHPKSFKDRCLFFVDKTSNVEPEALGPRFSVCEARLAVDTLTDVARSLLKMRDYLNAIDADGQFGSEVGKTAQWIEAQLTGCSLHVVSPHGLLEALAGAAGLMGGEAGPVFYSVFYSAAQAFVSSSSHEPVRWRHWMEAAAAARVTVRTYNADSPVLDALEPFAGVWDAPSPGKLGAAVRAAVAGAEVAMHPAPYALAVALRIAFDHCRIYLMDMQTAEPS